MSIFPFCNYPDPNKIQASRTLLPGGLWGETGNPVSVQANRRGANSADLKTEQSRETLINKGNVSWDNSSPQIQ